MKSVHVLASVVTTALSFLPHTVQAQASIPDSRIEEAVKALDAAKSIIRARFPDVQQMTTDELASLMYDRRRRPVILDVRSQTEYDVSHIPGAIRVDPSTDGVSILPLMKPGRGVVTYCSIGYRSCALANRILGTGAPWVYNLDGSIFQWANEGRPLESFYQPTYRVHPYNRSFSQMLLPDSVRIRATGAQ